MSHVQQASTTTEGSASKKAPPSNRPRLLLVQDNAPGFINVWDKFKMAGFEVELATTAHLAVEKLRLAAPHAIFLDLSPANSRGIDIIKEARRNKKFADRPIYVAATGAVLHNVKTGPKAASKVFDKASTSVDVIVAELAKIVSQHHTEMVAKAAAEASPDAGGGKASGTKVSLNPLKLFRGFARKADEPANETAKTPATPAADPPAAATADHPSKSPAPKTPTLAPPAAPPVSNANAGGPPAPSGSPARPGASGRPVVGVFTVDSLGKIVSADVPATKMFGWEAAELVGKQLKMLVKEGFESEFAKVLEPAGNSSTQLIAVRVTARTKDGTEFPVSITRLAWSSDTVTISKSTAQYTWTAVFRDLTVASSNTSFLAGPTAGANGATTAAAPNSALKELAEVKETHAMLRGANQALQRQLEAISARLAASTQAAEKAEKQRDELKARVEVLERQTKGNAASDTELQRLSTEKFELEQQLEESRRNRQQLDKVTIELEQAKAAGRRADVLEKQLRDATAELDRLRANGNQHAERQASVESELRAQLTSAKAAAEHAETDLKQKTNQCEQFQKELAALRRAHDDLNKAIAQSQQRTEELERQVRESTSASELTKAQHDKAAQDRAGLESALRTELDDAKSSLREADEQRHRLEDELAALRQQRNDLTLSNRELDARLQQTVAGFERLKEEHTQQTQQRQSDDSELQKQLEKLQQGLEKKDADLKEAAAQAKKLEREVTNLREERHELHAKYTGEKQAVTKTKRRIKELEKQLREIASAFNTTKQELEKRAGDRNRLESELEAELEAAKAAQHEQTVRANLLERELGQVCEGRDELRAELEVEQHKLLASAQRIEELEGRLRETAADLARAKAAAENHAAVVESDESVAATNSDALIRDLHRLREDEAAHAAEVAELERRVRDTVGSLAHVTADLETERSERRRVEHRLATLTSQLEQMHLDLKQHLESERANQARVTELEQQVRDRERALVRLRADLQKETANRDVVEQQLQAVGDMGAQLRQYLSLFEESKKVFKRTQEQLEGKLHTTQESLAAAEAKLQKEIAERHGLEASLSAAQRSLNDQYEQKVLELARLQSDLQVEQLERKRLEGDAHQSRYASLDSTRIARTMLNSLRRQLHDAIDTLMQATRRLLQISSEGEQKKLVQSVLESALLLQSSLEESSSSSPGGDAGSDPDLRSAA
jgi:PAS domain S-box-containing protein